MGEALKTNSTLSTLTIDSVLSDAAGTALGEALKTNSTLSTLAIVLRDDDDDDDDEENDDNDGSLSLGDVLCEALKTNRTLTTLDIDGDLNDEEVNAFGAALQKNPAIVTLGTRAPLGQEARAALSRNRELPDL